MDAARTRDAVPRPIGFIGDLDDPWVVAIAEALAAGRPVHLASGSGPLPDRPPGEAASLRAVVIHRHRLGAADAGRLEEWRARAGDAALDLILALSPYVRYEELERWSCLVDVVVSEAVARDILPGRLARRLDGAGRRPRSKAGPGCRIEIAGCDGELCRSLVDLCARAGYPARAIDEHAIGTGLNPDERDRRTAGGDRVLTIWEVPVLEPGWALRLESRAQRTGPVIALAGFADRAVVTLARQSGAVACLELPCDFDDLIDVVDRTVDQAPLDSWPGPMRFEPPHPLPAPRRNPRRHRNLVAPARWPEGGGPPTIPGRRDSE